ncbi:MAG: hypothetical protein IPM53_13720 [Anaerolineaceae bacterium]|nr:hypothetical protein [Anaerolineaceae bacterium]
MTSVITNNKVAFFLLVLAIVGLLTILAFAIVANFDALAIVEDTEILRYCVSSGGVCTGV